MTDQPDTPSNQITVVFTLDDGVITTNLRYSLDDLPEEDMSFAHAFMDGLMLMAGTPDKLASIAVEAHETYLNYKEVLEGKSTPEDTEEQATHASDNVVRLH